jgi:hypothetical protein
MEQIPLYKGSLFLTFHIDIISLSLIALAPTRADSPVICLNPVKRVPSGLVNKFGRLGQGQEATQVKHYRRWRTHSVV